MNEFVLLKTKRAILENPDKFCAYSWDSCIVGFAARLDGHPLPPFTIRTAKKFFAELTRTQKLLKLNNAQWQRLVQCVEWPKGLRSEYEALDENSPPEEGAKIAARRIDIFVATNGAQ